MSGYSGPITPQEQKQNLADLILSQHEKICDLQEQVEKLQQELRKFQSDAVRMPDNEYNTRLTKATAEHLRRVMLEHPYCDHVQVVKSYADILRWQDNPPTAQGADE